MNYVESLKPAFYHGDNEAGWIIMYENTKAKEGLSQGQLIFDTENEVKEAFNEGGEYLKVDEH